MNRGPLVLLLVVGAVCAGLAAAVGVPDVAEVWTQAGARDGVARGEASETPSVGRTPTTAERAIDPTQSASTQPQPSVPPAQSAGGSHDYRFPVTGCEATYARGHHDYPAADIFADRGCSFVAPVSGRVDEVSRTDTWTPTANAGASRGGRWVSIIGSDGVRYYGSHLEAVADGIRAGAEVSEGQLLGTVGESGSAQGTGPHLHFGISWPTAPGRWWVRRGTVAPQEYLDAWRSGTDRSPGAAVAAKKAQLGADPPCSSLC